MPKFNFLLLLVAWLMCQIKQKSFTTLGPDWAIWAKQIQKSIFRACALVTGLATKPPPSFLHASSASENDFSSLTIL